MKNDKEKGKMMGKEEATIFKIVIFPIGHYGWMWIEMAFIRFIYLFFLVFLFSLNFHVKPCRLSFGAPFNIFIVLLNPLIFLPFFSPYCT